MTCLPPLAFIIFPETLKAKRQSRGSFLVDTEEEGDHLSIDLPFDRISLSIEATISHCCFATLLSDISSSTKQPSSQNKQRKPCYPTPGDRINRSIHLKRASLLKLLVEDIPIGRQGAHLRPVRPLPRRPSAKTRQIRNDEK